MKVTQIETDRAIFIAGIGTMPKTIYASKSKFPDLKLELHASGVIISVGKHNALIPFTQIMAIMVDKPDEKNN